MPLEKVNAVQIFSEGGLDKLLDDIRNEAISHVPDLKTDKGRKAIASMSAKVSKSKTYLDGLGKELVSGWKNKAKVVDNERKKMRETLDDLRDKVRKPLTDWEESESLRKNALLKSINEMELSGCFIAENWQTMDQETMQSSLQTIKDNALLDFDEYEDHALSVMDNAALKIIYTIERRLNHDKEQVELLALREEKIAREESERKEKEAKAEADRLAKAEKERALREEKIAKDAADKAENAAAEEIKRAEDEKQKAIKEKVEADKRTKQAEKQAKIDSENAAKAEREKIESEKLAEKKAAEKREANKKHRKKINNEAKSAIMTLGVDDETAIKIVTAIAKGEIPNVAISY